MSKRQVQEAIEGYLFLLPNLLGFLIFMAVPLVLSVYYSLTKYDLLTEPTWVGLGNYIQALGFTIQGGVVQPNDPFFWLALGNTALYCGGVLVITIPLALMAAWLLNSKLKGITFFRALFFIPFVASIVGVALVWFWIYKQQSGVLNTIISAVVQVLNGMGLRVQDPNIGWQTDSQWALLSLIIMSSWAMIGYDMVIFLAALQGIPKQLFEAAFVDGASRWLTLRKIVIPLLSPTIFFVLVTNTINVIQVFSEPFIMTQGGPANSTMTIVLYLYRKGFQRFEMGYAASLAWIVFAIIFVITQIQFWLSSRWVYEE